MAIQQKNSGRLIGLEPSPMTRFPGMIKSTISFLLAILLFFFGCKNDVVDTDSGYFPQTGKTAIYQRALDLKNDMNVLSIAIRPGDEDLETLSYFRFARGANIYVAYLTNGEGSESDVRAEYGNYRAATLRNEAEAALSVIGGEAHFLNFADVVAYRDREAIEQVWPTSDLNQKLQTLLKKTQPDLILLAASHISAADSAKVSALRDALHRATTVVNPHAPLDWEVGGIYIRAEQGGGLSLPVQEQHPLWQKSYSEIAAEARSHYRSLAVQMQNERANSTPVYRPLLSANAAEESRLDAGLPLPASSKMAGIEQMVIQVAENAMEGDHTQALKDIAIVMDSVVFRMPKRPTLSARENRNLLMWKKHLDELRNALLGVKVHYTISDTALTALQLTFLNISQVEGIRNEGETRVFFGGLINDGWVINESDDSNLPLVLNDPYRLVSPKNIEFNVPFATNGLQQSQMGSEILFFVLHRETNPVNNFIHRSQIKIDYAPRFEAEVLTPIVRMGQGTKVLLKLVNHSRDGVVDTVKIADAYATAPGQPFRLSNKEDSEIFTFYPVWNSRLNDGEYRIPITIHGDEVAHFTAIKFDAKANTTKKVGLFTGIENSPVETALSNLQIVPEKIALGQNFQQQLEGIDVLILDKRVLTLQPKVSEQSTAMNQFVSEGGHLIILAQDAAFWNAAPLMEGIMLKPTRRHFGELPVAMKLDHPFASSPNTLRDQDWHGWIFLRGYNEIKLADETAFEQPFKAQNADMPLLVTQKIGEGRKTYVDLAISHQLQHVHAGAFRLLGNLISE